MPVAFLRADGADGFAPIARVPFRLGSGAACDLVDASAGVAPRHAEVAYVKGEYLLTPEDGCPVSVGGAVVPFLALRDGDEVRLGPTGAPWRFRARMEGSFRPPEASLTRAWAAHPASAAAENGPAALGAGTPLGARGDARCRRVRTTSGPLVVKRFGPARDPAAGDDHLALLSALGGSPHPALAPLVDGGLERRDGVLQRWAASRWVEGVCARDLVEDGGVDAPRVLAVMRALAEGVAHLHRRGVVHRDLAPGNVILPSAGGAVRIDYGHAMRRDGSVRTSAGVVGTPGYVAPEEVVEGRAAASPAVDVYGLGAVGYALLTGCPPARGEDLLATLVDATRGPVPPSELGVEVPEALEAVVLTCLAPDPAHRHAAATVVSALDFAGAQVGFGGRV